MEQIVTTYHMSWDKAPHINARELCWRNDAIADASTVKAILGASPDRWDDAKDRRTLALHH